MSSQRVWNIAIIDIVFIVILCFLYFILYQGAHGEQFQENTALVLMFFCAVIILSTTASLLHAMVYPHIGRPRHASYIHQHRNYRENIKRLPVRRGPKLPISTMDIHDAVMIDNYMMSLNQFMTSHGNQQHQQLYYNPRQYDCRLDRHENIHENGSMAYPSWQNTQYESSSIDIENNELRCDHCSEILTSLSPHYCNQSLINQCNRCLLDRIHCKCLNRISEERQNNTSCKPCTDAMTLCRCPILKPKINNNNDDSSDTPVPSSSTTTSDNEPIVDKPIEQYTVPIDTVSPIVEYISPTQDGMMESLNNDTLTLNSETVDSTSNSEEDTTKIKAPGSSKISSVSKCDLSDDKLKLIQISDSSDIGSYASERVDCTVNSVNNILCPLNTL